MTKKKKKKEVFKNNESYFEFFNKVRDTIKITSLRVLKTCIKIEYEDKL